VPIDAFRGFDDGLKPADRLRHEYVVHTNLEDEKLWVPYVDGVWFQACNFNVSSGGFVNVLKIQPGSRLAPHYHVSWVHGLTLQGSWRYLEHDWVAHKGTYIFEPPGEAHTLVVDAADPEPMITIFVLQGGLIYLDSVENGKVIGYDDGFTLLELARKHYKDVGLPTSLIDDMIR
jgi:2,4'-dihydroxyacetophenone dioxygenase